MESTPLTDQQLELLLAQGQVLDSIEGLLPPVQREALVALQAQAADAYAAGSWNIANDAGTYVVPAPSHLPTIEETRRVLGESVALLAEGEAKQTLVKLMQSLGLLRAAVDTAVVQTTRQR